MKTLQKLGMVLVCALLTGCAHVATYNPSYIREASAGTFPRYSGRVLVYNSPQEIKTEYSGTPKSLTGFAWTLKVPVGEFSKKSTSEIYGHLFDQGYDISDKLDTNNASRFAVITHATIEDFAWRMNQAKNAGFAITPQVTMNYHLQLLSPQNPSLVLFDRVYESGWVDGESYVVNFSPLESVNKTIHQSLANLIMLSESDVDSLIRNNNLMPPSFLPGNNNLKATGTGFFITTNGYLVTNFHVVSDANTVRLLTNKGKIDAKVVRIDPANDLALLKTEGSFVDLPVITSKSVQLGNTVATVGFPDPNLQGYSPKLSKGEISSLAGIRDDARYFQISVPLQPGNSGGALVDTRGNVVGIVSAKLSAGAALATVGSLPENVNYAIKSSFLLSFLESVPEASAKLEQSVTAERGFEPVVESVKNASVLVLVY